MSSDNSKTFGYQSSRDMLGKLGRELERLAPTTNRDHLIDYAFNAAWTAWHLIDWVWAEVQDRPKLLVKFAREAQVSAGKFCLEDFKRHILGDKGCPELRYCQIIATSAKHVGHDIKVGDPVFGTGVAYVEGNWVNAMGEEGPWVNAQGRLGPWSSAAWNTIIIDNSGTQHRAMELFGRVQAFWARIIHENQIGETQDDPHGPQNPHSSW